MEKLKITQQNKILENTKLYFNSINDEKPIDNNKSRDEGGVWHQNFSTRWAGPWLENAQDTTWLRYITDIIPIPTSREFNNSGGSCTTFIWNRNRRHAIEIGAEIPCVISDERLMDVQYYYILCMEELLTVWGQQDCSDDELILCTRYSLYSRSNYIRSALWYEKKKGKKYLSGIIILSQTLWIVCLCVKKMKKITQKKRRISYSNYYNNNNNITLCSIGV